MPGFGTTERTRTNALDLMHHLGVSPARSTSRAGLEEMRELGHAPFGIDCRDLDVEAFRAALARVPAESRCDLTFENVQARMRTILLMHSGFVVGTGDLSELALGWCTYNGDHMSMYNPNVDPQDAGEVPGAIRGARTSSGRAGAADAADDRRDDDLARAAAGRRGRRDRASDRGDDRPYELHDFFLFHRSAAATRRRRSCSWPSTPDFTRAYPRDADRADAADVLQRFFATSSSGRACRTARRSARSACRRAATGGCPTTPTRRCG